MKFPILPITALSLVLLAGCGGGDADPSTLLSASTPTLALAVSGTARLITVNNKGPLPTRNLRFGATDLPAGTGVRSTCPASLLPGASCLLVVTPGVNPSALPGDPAPPSALIELAGDNTNTLRVQMSVITYGSMFQGGFVFALDDSAPPTASVGGKVFTTNNVTETGLWSASFYAIPGIDDNSAAGPTSCDGLLDGRCNTARILATYPSGSREFAAARCADHRDGGLGDWYLPAVYELGYGNPDLLDTEQSLCGTQANPLLADNVRSRLFDTGLFNPVNLIYWSSTQRSKNPTFNAAAVSFTFGRFAFPGKNSTSLQVRCARAITP